jgi:hypothetical protein
MRFRIPIVVATALMSHWLVVSAQSQKTDPFDFLRPTIELSANDRRQLDERGIILRMLPASGQELATMAAASLNIGPDAFVAKVRNIVTLKKAPCSSDGKVLIAADDGGSSASYADDSDIGAIERCQANRCASN